MFDVPNLDCLSVNPNDLDAMELVFRTLAKYAKAKARAMRRRSAGLVASALVAEHRCERLYNQLPEWARW